jgi:IclR family pca regulon transcriptional regulator
MARSSAPNRSRDGAAKATAVPSLREPRYSQSLERGLAILRCFTPERPVLGIADIADELGMSRPTTHRYMITLLALGYLEQGPGRKYRLGLRVTDLGMAALGATGLREHVQPYLEELHRDSGRTSSVGVLDGAELLFLHQLPGLRRESDASEPILRTGSHVPAHCSAMGKLLLANLPEARRRELVGTIKLTRHGPNTITTRKGLREALEQISTEGYAIGEQELAAGLYAIAAPLRAGAGEVVAAIGLSARGSGDVPGGLMADLEQYLLPAAERISARLGYREQGQER